MTLADLRNKASRKLNTVLRAMILEAEIFPLLIPIAKPKTTAPLSELRATNQLIHSQSKETLGHGYTIEWETVNSKRHGKNDFASKLSFNSAEDFLGYVGAMHEAQLILSNVSILCKWSPSRPTRPWCAEHLALVRKSAEVIENAIKVLTYLSAHPGSGLYARQLPIQVPTKFFEHERALLEALAQAFAPECLVQENGTLEERLGLMTKESLIEFRSLDPKIQSLPFGHAMATTRELAENAHYFDEFETVIVIENHIPFLTLLDQPKTLAIMGNGFAVHRLSKISWMSKKRLFYWGDIDLSGLAILAKFRESHPAVQSIMMEKQTFQAFANYQKSHHAEQIIADSLLHHLTDEELDIVNALQKNGGLRLEQEHIDFAYSQNQIRDAIEFDQNNFR